MFSPSIIPSGEVRPVRGPRPPRPMLPPLQSVKLLDQVRERIRYLHYSLRTEEAYVHWSRAFIRFHGIRHPAELGGPEVEAFLSWLSNDRGVAVSTHRQALSALLFLYGKVLQLDLPWMTNIGRPQVKRRLPVVLSQAEVMAVLAHLEGTHRLLAQLLYGTGMRITEGLQLRVKDLDFERGAVIVREGKGGKDRVVMLPQSLVGGLRGQLNAARSLWTLDQEAGRAASSCRMRWSESTHGPAHHGAGSGCSRRLSTPPIRGPGSCGAIICMTRLFSERSSARWPQPASPSQRARTPSGMLLRPICCSRATTSRRCRSCWGMPTSPPP